MFLKQM